MEHGERHAAERRGALPEHGGCANPLRGTCCVLGFLQESLPLYMMNFIIFTLCSFFFFSLSFHSIFFYLIFFRLRLPAAPFPRAPLRDALLNIRHVAHRSTEPRAQKGVFLLLRGHLGAQRTPAHLLRTPSDTSDTDTTSRMRHLPSRVTTVRF